MCIYKKWSCVGHCDLMTKLQLHNQESLPFTPRCLSQKKGGYYAASSLILTIISRNIPSELACLKVYLSLCFIVPACTPFYLGLPNRSLVGQWPTTLFKLDHY